jgi:hypothetical protein
MAILNRPFVFSLFGLILLISGFLYLKNRFTSSKKSSALFVSINHDSSGINFKNEISTSDSLNIFTFEYIYNGGGVGIGDFNNDGLQDIFFVGSMVPSRLYLNQGNFHFKDITSSAGINTGKGWPFGVCVVDINQDGRPDIYVCEGGPGKTDSIYHNKLFINQGLDKNGDPYFKEMAAEYGLKDHGQSIQAVFFDYDHDGDLDMYLVKGGGFERSPIVPNPILKDGTAKNTDKLYRNDWDSTLGHPVFTDVSTKAGIVEEGFGLGVSLLDINDDGWLDIYVTDDYLSNDLLYVNNRNGTFTEKSGQYFRHTSHFAMGNDVGDINNDGLADIMAVDMLPSSHYDRTLMFGPNQYDKFHYAVANGYSYQYMRNTLQLNNGNGKFSEIGQLAGVYKTGWSWSVLFADLDNDQYQDIYITNGFGKDITDLDFVKFRANYISKPSEQREMGVLFDSLRQRPGTKIANFAFKNNGDLTFRDMSTDWGFNTPTFSNGAAYVDLDNDGALDLVVNNIDDFAQIYRNKLREKDTAGVANYLQIKLQGPKGNLSAIGAKVTIRYDNNKQIRLQSTVRGFESTISDILHFGLGKYKKLDSVEVKWPDGNESLLVQVPADQMLTIRYTDSHRPEPVTSIVPPEKTLFTSIPSSSVNIRYCQKESKFNDFLYEKLLPKKYSMNGPGIAVGDINGDGLEDFFVGGSYNQSGQIYIQNKDGTFTGRELSTEDAGSIDMGCLLFDADGDGDMDLFVVSGSSDYTKGFKRYQPRLYINDGKGNFSRNDSALPVMLTSGSCVVAGDYDGDGDLDLFIGGRIEPGSFPETPSSTLLRNDNGKFVDVTDSVAPGLRKLGMVTSALWTDINNDHKPDLMVVGEWMPISVFKNTGGRLINITEQSNLSNTEGWWQSIISGDFDNDGDIDYVIGNWGLNSPYTASIKNPMTVCYKDFDKDGNIDAILSYHEEGEDYPAHSWENVVQQMPGIRKKIPNYHSFSGTTTDKLLSILDTSNMKKAYCRTLHSIYLENMGNGKFQLHDLPNQAQFAPTFGMMAEDLNQDGKLDLVTVGNFYGTEVVIGRYDASIGLALFGDGKGGFMPVSTKESGFCVNGDAKALTRVELAGNKSLILASQNGDSLKIFSDQTDVGFERLKIDPSETSALIHFKNGSSRKTEFYYGNGYLSQSSRTLVITPDISRIELYSKSGKMTRSQMFNRK